MEGLRRQGIVSRWTGYHPAYLALRLGRMALRRPFLRGALTVLQAYRHAPPSPFPAELLRLHRAEQRRRLGAIVRHPLAVGRRLYAPLGDTPTDEPGR